MKANREDDADGYTQSGTHKRHNGIETWKANRDAELDEVRSDTDCATCCAVFQRLLAVDACFGIHLAEIEVEFLIDRVCHRAVGEGYFGDGDDGDEDDNHDGKNMRI